MRRTSNGLRPSYQLGNDACLRTSNAASHTALTRMDCRGTTTECTVSAKCAAAHDLQAAAALSTHLVKQVLLTEEH